MNLVVHPFFEAKSGSHSYVLANPASGTCAVIDPVLDYDPREGVAGTGLADQIVEFVTANGYIVEWILETNVHADQVSAAPYLKRHFICAQLGIGAGVTDVQSDVAARFDLDIATDGRQFDRLFKDNERICLGHSCGRVLHTPGYGPACVTYVFDQFAFVGDTLRVPSCGTARTDLPGGDAAALCRSIRRILALADETRLLTRHHGAGAGREHHYVSTVAEQKRRNPALGDLTDEAAFAARRRLDDRGLGKPAVMAEALCANADSGMLAEAQPQRPVSNGPKAMV